MVPGHPRMECDGDHGKIEKLKKKTEFPISHPHDWAMLIRLAGKKTTFKVKEMLREQFYDFAGLLKKDINMKKKKRIRTGTRYIMRIRLEYCIYLPNRKRAI